MEINTHLVCNFAVLGEIAVHALALVETERRLRNLTREGLKTQKLELARAEIRNDISDLLLQEKPSPVVLDLAQKILAAILGSYCSQSEIKAIVTIQNEQDTEDDGS